MSHLRHIPPDDSAADQPAPRAPLTTLLILVTVAATLSGRPVAMSSGHSETLPRLDRRQLVLMLAEELAQDVTPTVERPESNHLGLLRPTLVSADAGLPFALPSTVALDEPRCLAKGADWRGRLVNLPPPARA
jgi:hypothetical protein